MATSPRYNTVTQGWQPLGWAASITEIYLCTFLDQGRKAPGTQGYQPSVQHGNSELVALRYISVMEAARPMYFSGPRAESPGYKNVPRAISPCYNMVTQGW